MIGYERVRELNPEQAGAFFFTTEVVSSQSPRGPHRKTLEEVYCNPMMKLPRMPDLPYSYTCRFDFEVGHLVESPCRTCEQNKNLPRCTDACRIIDRVRGILADVVPCTRRL